MKQLAYYNENSKSVALWLRELIHRGLIAPGFVDRRSICDVKGKDLVNYKQIHLFAGIGGWSYALRLAGWADDRPVMTGSCPCQPFSNAGQRKGIDDERHLWPEMQRIIGEMQGQNCAPATIFGEQVASKAGREWLAGVRTDLETMDYAVGAADLCAACVKAKHIRQRIWWVAHSQRYGNTQSLCRSFRRMGRVKQSVSWDKTWQRALSEFRTVDDGLSYGMDAVNGPRNAIVPQIAAEFIRSSVEAINEQT